MMHMDLETGGTLLGGDRGAMRSHICQGECRCKVLHVWGGKERDDREATQGEGEHHRERRTANILHVT